MPHKNGHRMETSRSSNLPSNDKRREGYNGSEFRLEDSIRNYEKREKIVGNTSDH